MGAACKGSSFFYGKQIADSLINDEERKDNVCTLLPFVKILMSKVNCMTIDR